ncbi:anti-adapter protein IraP [Erwinia tasmaniensis]|uniref:anti-adapter protein IraP n=1 Tax=Erwinia tasmaniensis TaxID=338565 RepID=UPI003A4D8737
MKNVILSMLAKISRLDAETKRLTARVEAQSLLISALVLAVGKKGGVTRMIESANKAINTVIETSQADELLRSDAALLLAEFQDLLLIAKLIETADAEINHDELSKLINLPGGQLDNKGESDSKI